MLGANYYRSVLAAGLLCLSGCNAPQKPVPHVVVTPTGAATDAQIAAFKSQIEVLTVQVQTFRDMADRAAAAVYGVQNANPFNAPGFARDAVDAQAAEAASALPAPTAEAKLSKERQNAAILAGDLAKVKAEMGQTMTENQALRASLVTTEAKAEEAAKKLADATKAAEIERAGAATALQKQFNEMTARIQSEQKKVEQARDEERKSMMRYLAWALLGLGVIGFLVGGATLYLSKGAEWQRAAIAGLVGGCAFILYWTINQSWFVYLIWGCAGIIVAAVIWFLWRESAQNREREAMKQRAVEADEAEDTLNRTIRTIDSAPPDAPIKALTEKNGLLSSAFDAPNKALIHELKAEEKRTA
jgi:uncharacterized membrane protein